jgi:hypothetical protein
MLNINPTLGEHDSLATAIHHSSQYILIQNRSVIVRTLLSVDIVFRT